MTCNSDQEYSDGLCYTKCKTGHKGMGTLCWGNCQGTDGYDCGAFCDGSATQCKDKTMAFLEGGFNVRINGESGMAAYGAPSPQTLLDFASSNIGLAIKLLFDVCPATPSSCWKKAVAKSGSCRSGYTDGGALCWSRCEVNFKDCGAFCASSAVHCAKLTLILIQSGIDTFNSVNDLKSNWNPKAPTFDKVSQLTEFMTAIAGTSRNFDFPICS